MPFLPVFAKDLFIKVEEGIVKKQTVKENSESVNSVHKLQNSHPHHRYLIV